MSVIRASNEDFSHKMDALLSDSQVSPIYGSVNAGYYSIYSGKNESVSGLVTEIDGRPQCGFLYTQDRDGLSSGYFDMPAVLTCKPNVSETAEPGVMDLTKILLDEISSKVQKNRQNSGSLRVLMSRDTVNTPVFEEVLKISSDCSFYFASNLLPFAQVVIGIDSPQQVRSVSDAYHSPVSLSTLPNFGQRDDMFDLRSMRFNKLVKMTYLKR